jgi:hypothetical protein
MTRSVRTGWLPAVLVTAAILLALRHFEVSLPVSLTFLAYVLVGLTLPGMLVWRACHRDTRRPFVEDVCAGTAVGYGIEVLSYIPARAAGVPLLGVLGPLGVITAFLLIPVLRRHWRGSSPAERAPVWWSWALAGVVVVMLAWSYAIVSVRGLNWPRWAMVDMDSPFHLALLGELKHHVPPRTPFLSGEPLHYHWFVYADLAATSWATGIEPEILLYRLSMLPMLVTLPLLIALLGRRLTAQWWPGLVAVGISHFVVSPNPYAWRPAPSYYSNGAAIVEDSSLMRQASWTSPTQNFGALLFVPLVMVVIDLLRAPAGHRRRWSLLAGLLVVSMGTKATFLPLLAAGLGLVILVDLVVRRRWNRTAASIAGMTLVCLAFAQVVLYGGSSGGLVWQPGATARSSTLAVTTGLFDRAGAPSGAWAELIAIFLLCWVCIWFGVVGLAARRLLHKPEYVLLLGAGILGLAILMLLNQSGGSHGFFLQSARPYLALAAAAGLSAAIASDRGGRRTGAILVAGALSGTLLVLGVRAIGGPTIPTRANSGGPQQLMTALAVPYLMMIGGFAIIGAALVAARRRVPALRGITLALLITVVTGATGPAIFDQLRANILDAQAHGWQRGEPGPPTAPEGTREAGRWLRDHSGPDELVATNAHCRPMPDPHQCDNRLLWFSAYSERHFLVEAWGYTARAHAVAAASGQPDGVVAFWDQPLLAANDAAFAAPSPQTLGWLRRRYGVRWLFVDDRLNPSSELPRYATLRFRAPGCSVYELSG